MDVVVPGPFIYCPGFVTHSLLPYVTDYIRVVPLFLPFTVGRGDLPVPVGSPHRVVWTRWIVPDSHITVGLRLLTARCLHPVGFPPRYPYFAPPTLVTFVTLPVGPVGPRVDCYGQALVTVTLRLLDLNHVYRPTRYGRWLHCLRLVTVTRGCAFTVVRYGNLHPEVYVTLIYLYSRIYDTLVPVTLSYTLWLASRGPFTVEGLRVWIYPLPGFPFR